MYVVLDKLKRSDLWVVRGHKYFSSFTVQNNEDGVFDKTVAG